ncbi:phosphoglycerol transferase I [Serratia plymuthica]|uniref:Phosphoglycerol transferase I n=1 Tax=Serratia plymuthica TaxID=82996 RepID=A0A2X4UW86_SERPL|nr:phosphoglycerol transferase I [Serratia plymuthica]
MWAPELALSTDTCVASGNLAAPPRIVQAKGGNYRGKVSFTEPAADSVAAYRNAVDKLKVDDAAVKYQADAIAFMLPGMPQQVKAITGVSSVEDWGRWSDANLAPAVNIDYVAPLPPTFDLVLHAEPTAKTSVRQSRCAWATKSSSCRSASRTPPSPCASTTPAARKTSASRHRPRPNRRKAPAAALPRKNAASVWFR